MCHFCASQDNQEYLIWKKLDFKTDIRLSGRDNFGYDLKGFFDRMTNPIISCMQPPLILNSQAILTNFLKNLFVFLDR